MEFIVKTLAAGALISFASWAAGKKPVLAGFIIALPLTSFLGILFAYLQYRDMDKINRFAMSIVTIVPLSMAFFIPFLLNRWLKMNFAVTLIAALACLGVAYYFASVWFKLELK